MPDGPLKNQVVTWFEGTLGQVGSDYCRDKTLQCTKTVPIDRISPLKYATAVNKAAIFVASNKHKTFIRESEPNKNGIYFI